MVTSRRVSFFFCFNEILKLLAANLLVIIISYNLQVAKIVWYCVGFHMNVIRTTLMDLPN